MDRRRTGRPRRCQQRRDRQVALARRGGTNAHGFIGELCVLRSGVGVRIDSDGADAEPARGADDPAGDFAAVGDQQGFDHGLHPEEAEAGLLRRGALGGRKREAEYPPRLQRVYNAIVPQPGRSVVRMALMLILSLHRRHELGARRFAPRLALRGELVGADRCEHIGGLLAAHHGRARVRPLEQETRPVRATTHRVVASPVAAADDDRQLRHLGAGDGGDELRTVLGDATRLGLATDHEAGDVLQEQQRNSLW